MAPCKDCGADYCVCSCEFTYGAGCVGTCSGSRQLAVVVPIVRTTTMVLGEIEVDVHGGHVVLGIRNTGQAKFTQLSLTAEMASHISRLLDDASRRA